MYRKTGENVSGPVFTEAIFYHTFLRYSIFTESEEMEESPFPHVILFGETCFPLARTSLQGHV